MGLMTQAYLLEKYGSRLTVEELASELGFEVSTLYNKIAAGTAGVLTYKDGGKRFADPRDVAKYLDECRERAATPA